MKKKKAIVQLSALILISFLANVIAEEDATKTQSQTKAQDEIKYCESVGDKLNMYNSDKQVYQELEHKVRLKAVRQLYAEQLQSFSSSIFPENVIANALKPTILVETSHPSSAGLFTPCFVLKKPSISETDIKRFTRVNIAKLCNLSGSKVDGQEEGLRQRFTERLKRFDGTDDPSISYMINDSNKMHTLLGNELNQFVHPISDSELQAEPKEESLSDYSCRELYVYPIELYVASSKLTGE